jgi:hypothetical protein
MSNPRFLCDECVSGTLIGALRHQEPGIDLLYSGEPGAPPRGTLDSDVLIAAETLGRLLLTNDRQTMPGHLVAHFAAGRHTHGVILMRHGFSLARYLYEIRVTWHATDADEWIDQMVYLPY